jgi:isopropylmalate/homocitrate/citramalate synthase
VRLIIGKKSGRESVLDKLKELGMDASKIDLDRLLVLIKEESLEKKSYISDADLIRLVKEMTSEDSRRLKS